MANTYTLTSDAYDGRYLQLSCTQVINISSNKSEIAWTLESKGGNSNYYSIGPTTVTINGTRAYYRERKEWDSETFPAARGSTSGITGISHNADGAKKITVTLQTAIYTGSVQTYTGTWELDSIPRQAEITSAPNFNDTQVPKITYSNPLGSAADALEICIADSSATVIYAPYRNVDKTGSSYTFASSDTEILKQKTAGTRLDISYVMRTKIGGNYYYSTIFRKFTMTENTETKPDVSAAVTINNSGVPSDFEGMCIQSKSRLNINLSAQGKYGARIVSYATTVDGRTYTGSSVVTAPLQKSGNVIVTVSVVDSRGFKASAVYNVNVTAYSPPAITSFTAQRQANGTSVLCSIKGDVTSLGGKNAKAVSITVGSTTANLPVGGYTINTTATVNGMPTDETLTATVSITDSFSKAVKSANVPTVDVTMDFHSSGKGVAFGKVAETEELLDIGWNVRIKGNTMSDFVVTRAVSGIWTYEKWASGISKCWASKTYDTLEITQSAGTSLGGGYYKDITDFGSFPTAVFADAPQIIIPSINGNGTLFIMVRSDTPTFRICALTSTTTSTPNTIGCIAVGRWK